jgi:hypothetical protein
LPGWQQSGWRLASKSALAALWLLGMAGWGVGAAKATVLPLNITENTTLSAVGSPYTGTTTIQAGVTLTADPGVEFQISNMTVNGTLKAEGTVEEPVIFTGPKEEGPEWCRIQFMPGSGASVVDHAEIKYGGNSCGSNGMVYVRESSPTITNSTIAHSGSRGIDVFLGGGPEIANNSILDNATMGVRYLGASSSTGAVNIHDNFVEGGTDGINVSVEGAASVAGKSLGGNTIVGTTGKALSYNGPSIPDNITGNTLLANTQNVIAIDGEVAASSTWNDGGTPVRVESLVTVASGVTLKIAKGVLLRNPNMTVNGTLNAEGTVEEPVIFTGPKEEGPEWCRIQFMPGSGASVVDHAEIKYGGNSCGSNGMVYVRESSPTITNSTIAHSGSRGIDVFLGGGPEIANNSILDNATMGVRYLGASSSTGAVNIHDNFVEGGTDGINVSVEGAASVAGKSLGGNTIVKTKTRALYFSGPDIPGDTPENLLEDNASDDIQVAGTVKHSATWKRGGSAVRFTETVVIPASVTLELQPGVYIRSPQMTVHGTLHAEGTQSLPVTLTGVGELQGGEWDAIRLEPGSGGSVFNYVNVGFGGSGGAMLNVNGSSPKITNSAFRRSNGDAIRVQKSGQPTLKGIRFRNNQFGLRYEGEGELLAPDNDWGCANGPQPTGCGDSVTSNVSWQPAVVLQELPRLCPGTTMPATTPVCMLQKYQPTLRFDSEENFYADSAHGIADNWGDEGALWGASEEGAYSNALWDADQGEEPNGELLASSRPSSLLPYQLTLNSLGASYPNAQVADENDWIDQSNDYVRDAHRLEEAGYMHFAYGKLITDGTGKHWLQYWYWYYYNPKNFEGIGTHEGDWESILVGLDSNNRPLEVIFSQHESPSNCYIGDVELTEEGGPVAYVALDSHASYRKSGSFDGGVVTDYADGEGPSVRPGLAIFGSSPPTWLSWPGHWGNSRGGGLNSESPDGPAFHSAWIDPAGYAAGADECSRTLDEEFEEMFEMRSSGTAAADISSVTFDERRPEVGYRVPGADGKGFWPRLRISVNELGDGGIPPVSKTIGHVKAQGRIAIPIRVKPGRGAEVMGSIVYRDGRRIHLAPRRLK